MSVLSLDAPGLAAVALGVVACVCDVRTRRIPNALTFGASAVAFAFFLATAGLHSFGLSVVGWIVGFAVFLPFFLLGGMGAGDVKLVAAFGAWLGPAKVVWVALYGGIAGGVLALLLAASHGYVRQAFWNLGYLLWFWRMSGPRPLPALTLEHASGPRLAYAVPITIGMVATLWLR
ncbi:MAG: prepilin peptidase [Acidobacteria bacterium]|nr:prepilin peptidase [Acidobacteriota bacterium]